MRHEGFSERLKAALAARPLSRAELAAALDLHPSTVDYWCGGRTPNTATIERIALILGVSPSFLAFGEITGGA